MASRQRRLQIKWQAAGLCVICGRSRITKTKTRTVRGTKHYCRPHADQVNARRRGDAPGLNCRNCGGANHNVRTCPGMLW